MVIPSQSYLSEEGCHWFDVGISADVFILDVVLLCLASKPSQHSRLSGVEFLCIFFLTARHSDTDMRHITLFSPMKEYLLKKLLPLKNFLPLQFHFMKSQPYLVSNPLKLVVNSHSLVKKNLFVTSWANRQEIGRQSARNLIVKSHDRPLIFAHRHGYRPNSIISPILIKVLTFLHISGPKEL